MDNDKIPQLDLQEIALILAHYWSNYNVSHSLDQFKWIPLGM